MNYGNNLSYSDTEYQLIQPFGPTILTSVCPKNYLDLFNNYVNDVIIDPHKINLYSSKGGNIPDLLLRNIDNIYFDKEYCESNGIKNFLENLGRKYLEYNSVENFDCALSQVNLDYDLSFRKIKELHTDVEYFSVWANRYFSGDFTPIHTHESDLSGIIILDISDELLEEQENNLDLSEGLNRKRVNGSLQFLYNCSMIFDCGVYSPEQKIGDIYIFPSWLTHVVYPQKTNKERRSLSFNLDVLPKQN